MSERHGTILQLKRHEDFEKVAAYVKQQVRDKSIEQVGKDLSEMKGDDLVGLSIDEEESRIYWRDYGHHGDHLDFDSIAECVIKVFPEVEMERKDNYGQSVWNYIVADGKWQEYTLWKFVVYIDGKGEETLLEYKEPKEGRTEEEKNEIRNSMCREMAERQSLQNPGVEIAVYASDYYSSPYTTVCWDFYRAKDGRATKDYVDSGVKAIMDCGFFDEMEWVEGIGHVLLHPMEFAAEVLKRARGEEDYYPQIATKMMMNGDTAKYFSLIEPTDKKWLMKLAEEDDNIGAIYCLLHGMRRKYEYWNETFIDEETNEEVSLLRPDIVEGSTFEKNEGEEEHLIQKVMEQKHRLSVDELTILCFELDDNKELLLEQINKGDEEAAIFIDDPVILQELCDKGNKTAAEQMGCKYAYGDEANGIFIDHKHASRYMELAGKDYNPKDYEEEDMPREFDYILKGNAETLSGICTMIDDLCHRFGTPDNEFGMYVPLGPVMKVLVGTPYYRGNIMSMNQDAPDCLTLHAEANSGEPLLYALRRCYENLSVEMKETE